MCGVVSIVYNHDNRRLGKVASFLLRKLEYRGYDSTGGAFIKTNGEILLKKKVGAPSLVTRELDMESLSGKKFIGQVRWATFGAVTDINAQPHEMNCFEHMVGAHNGNITNTDSLKEFLTENGHKVASDNDGEMLIHMVEHFYHGIIREKGVPRTSEDRISFLKAAIKKAQGKVVGSYAACVTVPGLEGVFAMKSGSSLYAGKGRDEDGEFIVVSSDLTSVLSKTRFLIPLEEGEGLYFTHKDYHVFSLTREREYVPEVVRSKLNVDDIALRPEYRYYMEQEIFSSPANVAALTKYYLTDNSERKYHEVLERYAKPCSEILTRLSQLGHCFDQEELLHSFKVLINESSFVRLLREIKRETDLGRLGDTLRFTSDNAILLTELFSHFKESFESLFLLDLMTIWKKKRTISKYKTEMLSLLRKARDGNGRVFFVASGTSYHASLLAGYFFNNLASLSIVPMTPGVFRALYLGSLRKDDVVVGISQSGETKDLIDVFNSIRELHDSSVTLCSIVNNENSTLPLEKSKFYLPVLCGPEIAVAATKSFISQIALFYLLANNMDQNDDQVRNMLSAVQGIMTSNIRRLEKDISDIADKLYLKPSIHILGTSMIGLAKETALKIREVVINHTEGYDAAEFKHGPNTILGKNTLFSFEQLKKLAGKILERGMDGISVDDIGAMEDIYCNYPLLFICPPDPRDKRITISQIHTHKIRGADIILVAEEDEELRKAVEGKPANLEDYYCKYIPVETYGDKYAFVFEAALAMQYLALKMSVVKGSYLDRQRVKDHGVHPDVPKNVSKSITVD
ncbi:MAG: SIS domain-containing protein [Oligoflexales bacterium]|nr:SIS domain-containing protein [Oligoflexales bacterium]